MSSWTSLMRFKVSSLSVSHTNQRRVRFYHFAKLDRHRCKYKAGRNNLYRLHFALPTKMSVLRSFLPFCSCLVSVELAVLRSLQPP